MSETKTLKNKTEVTSLDADEVILNIKKAALNLDDLIDRHIKHKYPDKAIRYVNKDDAKTGKHKGWEMLKFVPAFESLEVVKSIDDATTTTGNVLCWRDKRIQDYIDSEESKVRMISNMKAQGENSKTQAESMQATLAQMSGGKIKVKPLEDNDD